jgi:hypothetical protein
MGKGRMRVLRAIPGPGSASAVVRDFCRPGHGVVTCFSDARLRTLRPHVDEDSPVELLSFGETVRRVLTLSGEEALPLAQAGLEEAAIAEACRLLPEDSPLARSAGYAGLHSALDVSLSEMRLWGVGTEELRAAAERVPEELADKLRSLALVDEESGRLLNLLGRARHADQLRAGLEATPEHDGSFERLLVVVGAELAPLRLRWLRRVAETGTDVTVVLDRHAASERLFPGAQASATLLGVLPEDVGEGNRLLRNLFAERRAEGPTISVEMFSAADPLAEAEWALRRCLEADSPGECLLFVRDLEGYAPLVESAALRLGVPLRMERRAPLLTNAFARLTLAVLEACASSDVRTLEPILKSSFLRLDGEAQAALTGALRDAHRRRGAEWEALGEWSRTNAEAFPWLERVREWREAAHASPADLAEWSGRLRSLMDGLPWHEALDDGLPRLRARDVRAQSALQRTLAHRASVARVCDRPPLTLPQFAHHCRRTWEAADVSVPTGEAGVTVASSAEGLEGAQDVFVLGMLEGVFPRRRSEDPVLTDDERRQIFEALPLDAPLPNSFDRAARERDELYRLCAAAGRRLAFSYPLTDDQRDNIPAFYLTEIEAAAGEVARVDHPRTPLAPPDPVSPADAALREALEGEREGPLPVRLESEEARACLRVPEEAPVSPEELRDARQCPFRYVARRRLKLSPRRRRERWAGLQGLPAAADLMRKETPEEAEAALEGALAAELDRLGPEIPEWELRLLESGGRRLIRGWVRREFVAREVWPKVAGSLQTHVRFGDGPLRAEMPGGIRLDGGVPAVSQLRGYGVVHLYSRGVAKPDEMPPAERLYLGLHLLAARERDREPALEVETMDGGRSLVVLDRHAGGVLTGRVDAGLQVVDLGQAETPLEAHRRFFEEFKGELRLAASRVRGGEVVPTPGPHCDWCDFGELCRRSKNFGEDEESPFGRDDATDG